VPRIGGADCLDIFDANCESAAERFIDGGEWNVCLQAGIGVTIGYCHNFVGFRPNGGRAQVGVGIGGGVNANFSGGRYSEESVTASAYWGGGVTAGWGDGNFVFCAGVGFGGSGATYSATPEAWERRFPGIRQGASNLLEWLGQ
jgi:hypothetical protein